MRSFLAAAVFFLSASTGFSFCEDEAKRAALDYAANAWSIDLKQLGATIAEAEFNETYGRGSYDVHVDTHGAWADMLLNVQVVAYSNEDDSEFTCVAEEITELDSSPKN